MVSVTTQAQVTWIRLAKLFCRNKHSVCKQNCYSFSQKASSFQSMRQLGQGSKVKGSKPFGVYFLAEPLAAFQAELLETVHTKAFCQQTTDSWLRRDPVTKILSFAFLSLSWLWKFIKIQGVLYKPPM